MYCNVSVVVEWVPLNEKKKQKKNKKTKKRQQQTNKQKQNKTIKRNPTLVCLFTKQAYQTQAFFSNVVRVIITNKTLCHPTLL